MTGERQLLWEVGAYMEKEEPLWYRLGIDRGIVSYQTSSQLFLLLLFAVTAAVVGDTQRETPT